MNLEPNYDWTILVNPEIGHPVAHDNDDRQGTEGAEELYQPFDEPGYLGRRQAPQALSAQRLAGAPGRRIPEHDTNRNASDRGATSESPEATVDETSGPWPDPLDPAALHGLAGEIVNEIGPFSEADPAALLLHTLVGVGVLVGPDTYATAANSRHPARLFVGVVGLTSRGRKGSAYNPVQAILEAADADFVRDRIVEGLSSGEGLIYAVRDRVERVEQIGKGPDRHPELVTVDEGVSDKRLLVVESEFSSPLRMAQRDGNTLSAVVRRAWDGHRLQTLTKNSPTAATGAHIGLIGHITRDELLRCVDRLDLGNGFANRFLWCLAQRSKQLPHGDPVPEEIIADCGRRIAEVASWARQSHVLRRDGEANDLWETVYGGLTEGRPGLIGAITSRAEAQVLRLSVAYAILDRSHAIAAEHLLAALAVWRYADASAEVIFGDAVGDPVADTILAALRRRGSLTRTDISNLLSRHGDRSRIEAALASLVAAGLAESRMNRGTGGRPQEVWFPVSSHNSLYSQGSTR